MRQPLSRIPTAERPHGAALYADSSRPASGHAATLANLDFLRGIAAVAVLLWHYQHFYYLSAGSPPPPEFRSGQPFFDWLRPLYLHGWMAVEFFWTISGFVLFHVYGRKPGVDAHQYFWARFSRLYPLHLITLLLVALLQAVSLARLGHFQIYSHNDLYHFCLQLFFASDWGFQKGFSFNAPIWSVSVEVISYLVFLVYCRASSYRLLPALAIVISCHVATRWSAHPAIACMQFFFAGCAAGIVFHAPVDKKFRLAFLGPAILILGAALAYLSDKEPGQLFQLLLFSGLVLGAAQLDRRGLSTGRWGIRIGQITYASYLIHIPIQITTLLILDSLQFSRNIANQPLFFVGFLCGTLLLSILVFRFIEMPFKNWVLMHAGRARS